MEPSFGLGAVVMMVMVTGMMVVMRGGESRARKDHQQQCSQKKLLHASNVARAPGRRNTQAAGHQKRYGPDGGSAL